MSETPQDISFVKFLDTPQLVTPVVTEASQGLWATYDVVNVGTAPSTAEDSVSAAVTYQGAVVQQTEQRFDNPVLEANGGSHRGNIHVPFETFQYEGQWQLIVQVNRPGYNQGISDAETLGFTVELAKVEDPGKY
jgi:hypothetical protein